MAPPEDRRAWLLTASAFWLLAAALVLLCPVLPLQDGPTHLALLHARERVLAGDPFFAAHFRPWPISSIYWLCYRALDLLSAVVSWEMALRLLLLGYLAAWGAALHLLLGRDPARRWYALLAAPVAFNGVFFLGFLNTLALYPLGAASLALLSRGEPRGWRQRVLLALLALATFLIHPAGWALWTALAFPLALALHPGDPRGRLREALPLLLPALLIPIQLGAQSGEAGPGERPAFAPRPAALLEGDLEAALDADWRLAPAEVLDVMSTVFPYATPLRLLTTALLGLGLLVAARVPAEGRTREQTIFLRACLAVLLLGPLLPFRLGFSAFFNLRLFPWGLLLLLCALPPGLASRPRGRAALVAVGLALFGAVAVTSLRFSREASDLLELARPHGTRRTVLPLFITRHSRAVPLPLELNLHLPSLLQLRQEWIHPWLWSEGAAPLRYVRPPAAPRSAYEHQELTAEQARSHELVLIACDEEDPAALADLERLLAGPLAGFERIDRRGAWSLWRAR